MSSIQRQNRRFTDAMNMSTNPSQIMTTLRSAVPSETPTVLASNGTNVANARSTRLSELANMLSIPNLGSFSSGHRFIQGSFTSGTASVHPSFRSKAVCSLNCKYCGQDICGRGMKAILLSDTRVELFSTDVVPAGRVQLVGEDYMTNNCHCRIRDVACLGCGNVSGYHVTQPCDSKFSCQDIVHCCIDCMSACNNGHFWMFHDDAVSASERTDASGKKPLLWAQLTAADRELECHEHFNLICR